MNDSLVSVITPLHNCEKYITETINSIQSQSYENWEMIIIDDCSDDKSVCIVEAFMSKDKRIRLFRNHKNYGSAITRNIGLKKANGRFIAFCDSDDVWLPSKLELQTNFMLKYKVAISFTEYDVFSEDLKQKFYSIKVPNTIDYNGYLKNTIIGMSTSMIDRNLVEPFTFHNIRTRQDTYLWISLLKRGHVANGLNEKLVKYRIRKESISANKIQAAKRVWFLYYNLEKLGIFKSAYYFTFYAFNAIKKRN